jgi:hypothetical protein
MEQENTEKKRGRPKVIDREVKSKSYTLKVKPSTFRELNRICGLRQLETGQRASVSDLVNTILDEYVALHGVDDK